MERVPGLGVRAALVSMSLLLASCANLQTVNRESTVPLAKGKGRAIHLDAQQRMVVFAAERFCAEPSPDALAAYASALGLGASHGSKTAANAATSLNSVAGSIGLRTQSITLMRDTLYRTCEASMNGSLSDEQVAMLMARSQDLTAVVLAIEQLTGTVAAPPVTLTPGGAASSATALLASTEALNAVNEAVTQAEARRNSAEAAKNEKQEALERAVKAREDAFTAWKAAPDDELLAAYEARQEDEKRASAAADQARRDFESKDAALVEFKKTQQRISIAHDSSSTAVSSSVTSGASLGSFVYHSNIDKDVGTEIAEQVGKMVRRLLYKDYFAEACMATIMRPSAVKEAKDLLARGAKPNEQGTSSQATPLESRATKVLDDVDTSRNQLVAKCMDYFAKYEPHYPTDEDAESASERQKRQEAETKEGANSSAKSGASPASR